MKYPHCLVEFHYEDELVYLNQDSDGHWFISKLCFCLALNVKI
jgi:hypothetical protein